MEAAKGRAAEAEAGTEVEERLQIVLSAGRKKSYGLEKKAVDLEAHNRYISCGFLIKANENKYGHVKANLENDYMKGNDYYPKTMPDAYKYLSEFNTGNSGKESYSRHSNHLAFMQGNPKDGGKACFQMW